MAMKKKVDELNKVKRVNEAIKTYARNNKKNNKVILYSEQQKLNKKFTYEQNPEVETSI